MLVPTGFFFFFLADSDITVFQDKIRFYMRFLYCPTMEKFTLLPQCNNITSISKENKCNVNTTYKERGDTGRLTG